MKAGTRRHYEELVLRAVEQVLTALDQPLDLGELGRQAHLSPLHFHRIVRGLLGETPGELHRRLRLERAAWSLASGELPVTRIALEAGYDAHESFTRAFTGAFGLPPSELRARVRDNPVAWAAASASALPAPSGIHFDTQHIAAAIRFTGDRANMNVIVKPMPAKRVLAVAHRGPYNTIGSAFARLDTLLPKDQLGALDGVEMVALFHDDAEVVPAAELRADAGVVVPEHVAVPSGLHVVSIAAGVYACTVHEGSYDRLGDSWARFMGGWLVESAHRVGNGPMYERYLNTPMNAATSELRTELYVCLADDSAST